MSVATLQALCGLFTLVFTSVLGVHFFWICGGLMIGAVLMYQGRTLGLRLSQVTHLVYASYLISRLSAPSFPVWLKSPVLYLLPVTMVIFTLLLTTAPARAYFNRGRRAY